MTAKTGLTQALSDASGSTTRRGALWMGAALTLAPAGAAVPLGMGAQADRALNAAGVGAPATLGGLEGLEAELRGSILWQDGAVAAVAGAIRRWHAGSSDPQRPVASFLFLGPQAVGKTMLARSIARHLFGSQDAVAHLDAGKLGQDGAAALAAAVRGRPAQLLLVDAVDQAKPAMLQALRQILATGRLGGGSDALAFRKSAIVMTTTAETSAVRPELLRRIDQLVTFNPLDQVALRRALHERAAKAG